MRAAEETISLQGNLIVKNKKYRNTTVMNKKKMNFRLKLTNHPGKFSLFSIRTTNNAPLSFSLR